MGDKEALLGDEANPLLKMFGQGGFAAVQLFLVSVYLTLNTVLNIFNKYVLSSPEKHGAGLHTPLFMTFCHGCGCFLLAAIMTLTPYYTPRKITQPLQWLKIIGMAIFFSCGVGFNNSSLLYIPLSLAQMIKSSHPALLAFILYFIEGARYSKAKIAAIFFIVFGISLSVMGSSIDNASMKGVLFSLGSVCSGAFYIAYLSVCLNGEDKLKSFDMLLYVQPCVALLMLPMSYATGEFTQLENFVAVEGGGSQAFWLLMGGTAIAVVYNLTTLTFIKTLSAIYLSVTGTAKVALVIFLSVMFFGDHVSPTNACGVIIALIAFGFNSYLTYQEKVAKGLA